MYNSKIASKYQAAPQIQKNPKFFLILHTLYLIVKLWIYDEGKRVGIVEFGTEVEIMHKYFHYNDSGFQWQWQ